MPKPAETPYDKRLWYLIGELSTRSEEVRVRWAAHNVKLQRTGVKSLWKSAPAPEGDPGMLPGGPVSYVESGFQGVASWK